MMFTLAKLVMLGVDGSDFAKGLQRMIPNPRGALPCEVAALGIEA